jgi:8-oxo-dGTP pyrophosphatase MutT (NUDIX family)
MNKPAARWRPSTTVAAVIEHAGRYLLVEERTPEGLRLNNPAGHLEPGESLLQGVVREVLEETRRAFSPQALLGVYLSRFVRPARDTGQGEDITYLRFAFCGSVGDELPAAVLDSDIVRTLWLTPAEMRQAAGRMRSPLVLACVEDHLAGKRYPLAALVADASVQSPRVVD